MHLNRETVVNWTVPYDVSCRNFDECRPTSHWFNGKWPKLVTSKSLWMHPFSTEFCWRKGSRLLRKKPNHACPGKVLLMMASLTGRGWSSTALVRRSGDLIRWRLQSNKESTCACARYRLWQIREWHAIRLWMLKSREVSGETERLQ